MRRLSILAISILLLAAPARAQRAELRLCEDFTIEAIAQVRACSALVNSGYEAFHALLMRGAALVRSGDLVNARKDYLAAIGYLGRKPSAPSARWYNSHCWALAIINSELDTALADCNAALKQKPNEAEIHDSRGLVYIRMGKYQEAISDYNFSLGRNLSGYVFGVVRSGRPYSLYGRGIAKLGAGDTEGGKSDIAEAEKLRPSVAIEFGIYGLKP